MDFKRRFALSCACALGAILGLSLPLRTWAESPVVYVTLASDTATSLELSAYANQRIRPRLQGLFGVAKVEAIGVAQPVLLVRIDPRRLEAYGLRRSEVERALSSEGILCSSERREDDAIACPFPSVDRFPSPERVGRIGLSHVQGSPISLLDVATVELSSISDGTDVTYRGRRVVALGLIQQWWANTPAVLLGLRQLLPSLRPELPPGMKVEATFESALKIEKID